MSDLNGRLRSGAVGEGSSTRLETDLPSIPGNAQQARMDGHDPLAGPM
jgi:hypothetical protein